MSCGVGHRCGSDLALLWLWCRPAPAALIQPLAWELPYAFIKRKASSSTRVTIERRVLVIMEKYEQVQDILEVTADGLGMEG